MKKLSSKRKIMHQENWSSEMHDILRSKVIFNGSTFDFESVQPTNEPEVPKKHERDLYESQKRALINHQKFQKQKISTLHNRSYEKQGKCRQLQIEKQKRRVESSRNATIERTRDQHVLENVIAQRSDEYISASEYLPEGYSLDLSKSRQLPPDKHTFLKASPRVFYWG